jgi:hypothetical protein
MCSVPSVADFCSSLMLCFPGMLFRYFMNYFEMVVLLLFSIFTCISVLFVYAVLIRIHFSLEY